MSQDKPTNPKDAIAILTKPPLHLWPASATALGCLALLEGMLKYGRSNWRKSGVRASIYKDALDRHMSAWFEGEELDPGSGVPHLGHALACIAIIVDAQAAGKLVDDRQFPGGYRTWMDRLTSYVPVLLGRHADRVPAPKHYDIRDKDAPEPSPTKRPFLDPAWF